MTWDSGWRDTGWRRRLRRSLPTFAPKIDRRIEAGPSHWDVGLIVRLLIAERRGLLRDLLETSTYIDETAVPVV
jgi:hypothetical protein